LLVSGVAGWKGRKQVNKLLHELERLASDDGRPYAAAAFDIARGVAAHLQSRYVESITYCDSAVARLLDIASQSSDGRCRDAAWEVVLARSIALWSFMYMGRIDELSRRLPDLSRAAEEKNDLLATLNFGTQVRTYVLLGANDDPAQARERLDADEQRLSQFAFMIQHENYWLARAFLEQYCGNGLAAWECAEESRRRFEWSSIYLVQHMRIDYFQMRCRAALAAAHDATGAKRAYLIGAAIKCERRLRSEKTPWATALATLMQVGIERARGGVNVATICTEAIQRLEALDVLLFAAVARACLAELTKTGGAEADAGIAQLGASNPRRLIAAILPGFGST
jgi:hypothetical protein